MMELSRKIEIQVRPPPKEELCIAFKSFFAAKKRTKESLPDVQARNAFQTFLYLQETNNDEPGFGLSIGDLCDARDALTRIPRDKTSTHNQFARALFEEIMRRKASKTTEENRVFHLLQLISVLALTGDAMEARS